MDGLHLCLYCSRASGSSSQKDHCAPTRMAHACMQSTHVYLHVPARLKQEPSKGKKNSPPSRSNDPSWVSLEATCEVLFRASAGALAQPPRNLSPHVTFDCDPIGTPDLARSALAIYRGKHLQASSSLVNFRHTHMQPTRLCQKKMTYNTITCSPSRQNS